MKNNGLNPVCARFNNALMGAMAAIHHLSDHGCVPLEITLSDRKPVITIEPPKDSDWIRGALKSRITTNMRTRHVMAAPFHGCQVEWEISEARNVEAQRA